MSEIVVVRGSVDDGKKIYGPGEVVPGLSDKDQEELVENGFCRWRDDEPVEPSEAIGGENDPENPPPPAGDDLDDPPEGDDGDGGPDTSVPVAEESKKRK